MKLLERTVCTALLAAMVVCVSAFAGGPYETHEFRDWPNTTVPVNYTDGDGWAMLVGYGHANGATIPFAFLSRHAPGDMADRSILLDAVGSEIKTPALQYGIGTVSFWAACFAAGGSVDFAVEKSVTGVSGWQAITNLQYTLEAWKYFEITVDDYNARYLRIRIDAESGTDQKLGLDDIYVKPPPAIVDITQVETSPDTPIIGDQVDFKANIQPWSDAAGLTATAYWRIGTNGPFTNIAMQIDGPPASNNWITVDPIPSLFETYVEYYVEAVFSGTDASSPTYYPAGGSSNPAPLIYRQPVFRSSFTNVTVTGSFTTNLTLTSDYLWQGTLLLGSPETDPTFRFEGTNEAGITVLGDDDQVFTDMPVFGGIETNGANIAINGTVDGYLLFTYDEASLDYSAQKCVLVDFDDWTGASATNGTYTNAEGWVISDCRLTTNTAEDLAHVYSGRTCIMDDDSDDQFIMSPYLTNGVGEIGFWYRNWETNGASPTDLHIQVATNPVGPWYTVYTMETIRVADYLHFSLAHTDRENHYVRIIRDTAKSAKLCIDEVFIAEPGPGVSFSVPTTIPASPDVTDTVDIQTTCTLLANATDPQCTLWYRYNTNYPFKSIPMERSALTFTTSNEIPRHPVGAVQYYIECSLKGMSSTARQTVYFPTMAGEAPLQYTVQDAYLLKTFVPGWPNSPAPQNYTDGEGWYMEDGYGHLNAATTPFAFLSRHAPGDMMDYFAVLPSVDSSMMTPLRPFGVGIISFWAANKDAGSIGFVVETSPDALVWTTIGTATNTLESWTQYEFEINDSASIYVRVRKTSDISGEFLGIDDILITYPPAMVRIHDAMIHPGYPASNDVVDVSCYIDSVNPVFRAFNITGAVKWRAGGGSFADSIDMTQASSNYFVTSIPIPAQLMSTKVEYYIESRFDGYAYTNIHRFSPTFLPTGIPYVTNTQYYIPPNSYFEYIVRAYRGDYDFLQTAGTAPSVNMELQDDYVWQGIIDFGTEPSTNPSIELSGFSRYTGSNYWPVADTWGDPYQTRTTVPMFSIAQPGETNAISMSGTHVGQYVFRFDEKNLTYILQRCAFQDFNDWYADDQNFSESWSFGEDLVIQTNDFNDWPMPTNDPLYAPWPLENFQSWPVMTNYSAGEVPGINGWNINVAKTIEQIEGNMACQLRNDPGFPYVRPIKNTATYGVGNFDFEYRCVDTNHYPSLYQSATNWDNTIISVKNINATDIPADDDNESFGKCWLSLYSRYVNPNYYYELRLEQTSLSGYALRLYRKNGPGDPDALHTFTSFPGTIDTARSLDWLVWTAGAGKVRHEVWWGSSVGSYYENNSGLTTVNGAVGIDTMDADIELQEVSTGWGQLQYFDNWWNTTYTNIANNQSWRAKYCYINGDYARFRDPTPNDGAFLRSPFLPHGVSLIRFGHRDNGQGTYSCTVQWSPTGGDTDVEWTDMFTTTPRTGNWTYQNFYTNVNQSGYVRVRIVTNSTGGFRLDGMSIRPYYGPGRGTRETFDDGTADGWSNPGGWWYCTNDVVSNAVYRRPGYTSTPIEFEVQTTTWNNRNDLSQEAVWRTNTTFTGLTQTRYESVSVPIQDSGYSDDTRVSFVRLKHTGGNGSLVLDDLQFHHWHGQNLINSNNQWTGYEAWTIQADETNRFVELRASRSYDINYTNQNNRQRIRSALMTNGVGIIAFRTSRYSTNDPACAYEVRWSQTTSAWEVLRVYTNSSEALDSTGDDQWKYHAVALNTNAPTYVEIAHLSSDPDAHVLIDDVEITGYSPRNEFNWIVYNGLVTHLQTNRQWTTGRSPVEKTAYLNYGPGIYGDTPELLTNLQANVQSPLMPGGIGEISFWYRNWTQTSSVPATLRIKAAPAYTTPEEEWTEIAVITNFVATEWRYFRQLFYDTTNKFVRFYADLAPSDRICIDDLLVMYPLGADLIITNLVTVPAVPLEGQPVHVRADLGQFLLNVVVTNCELRYVVGTNNWADWDPGNVIEMEQITNNPILGSYTWQTKTRIPAYGIDTTVQYYVYCQFDGRFANRGGSPKKHRSFKNPDHYWPTDYNDLHGVPTNRIPYYIVFSCNPGAVWPNELNLADSFSWHNEYIELAGPAGVDIGNWQIELRNANGVLVTNYTIPPGTTMPDDGNGYGYWVLGDGGVAAKDMTLDYLVRAADALDPGNEHIPFWGGLRLYRSMGAEEYAICWNTDFIGTYFANNNYEFLNNDDAFWFDYDGAMQWQGTGTTYEALSWALTIDDSTPGALNDSQWIGDAQIYIEITRMNLLPGTIEMRYIQTGGGSPSVPWYSTNLMETNWFEVTDYTGPVDSNGTNVITFDLPTNYPCYFYRLTSP